VHVVIYDDRPGSATRGRVDERVLQRSVHGVLHIPAGLWYGFRGVAAGESVILNCVSEMHDPTESERRPTDTPAIPYRWPAENPAP
jgi:dTDP-4-dehydrorhamnose 3,5-epimerase